MHSQMTLLALAIVPLVVLGPAALAALLGRLRARRREAARLQIALTDALDGALGPLVAPVVRPPLLRPWRIEIAVPFGRPKAVGRMLAITHEFLSGAEGMAPDSYRLVLSPRGDSRPAGGAPRAARPADTAAAA